MKKMKRLILVLLLAALPLVGQITKPPPGASVDWGNSINRGLISWWLFNEGAGARVADIAGTLQPARRSRDCARAFDRRQEQGRRVPARNRLEGFRGLAEKIREIGG